MTDQSYSTPAPSSITLAEVREFVRIVSATIKPKARRAICASLRGRACESLAGTNVHRLRFHEESEHRGNAMRELLAMMIEADK